ncbi:N-acetylmuramate alpha-1-phosphate uridylyltransferase MurU [Catenovulum adriaticum]|uniref:Nucleotidyltransferase family protein n=1 Tax=Catenovulum adriaticum TaxID=2984846 RepID=A0ABY7AQ38_9ALTE|nr:nucleotidyltransferase family protein [Catenovulum sp. TS8]WAJ70376.1 nucleotidyltransferase family protein [Catenovulum sp. TS8]
MKAMILAAGKGTRMRPLTLTKPKPLLEINGQSLIEYHIKALVKAGITELVINHAYLGEQIPAHLGDGSRYQCHIQYSEEAVDQFETAGGIINALPLLGEQPFLVVNADIWCDYPFSRLIKHPIDQLAHLVLVKNPPQHPTGDFAIDQGMAQLASGDTQLKKYTFSGIAIYQPEFFRGEHSMPLALGKLLRNEIKNKNVSAELYNGQWSDIGTPERLANIKQKLAHI